MPILLFIGMLTLVFNIQPVKASGTIYIRADGSVDPLGVPISNVDNVTYTFTADIYDSIVVERNNIIIDGAGYTLEGPAAEWGIYLSGRKNVTIKNMEIKVFTYGIYLKAGARNNHIYRNNITNNEDGIRINASSNNHIYGNNINANNYYGVHLGYSSENSISRNNITNNGNGIYLDWSSDNTICGNNINANNEEGVALHSSSHNTLSGNNIKNSYNYGIWLKDSSNFNGVSGNNINANNDDGIVLGYSSKNNISGNNITNNGNGIYLGGSSENNIYGNNITNNRYGVYLGSSSNNTICGNNINANDLNGTTLSGSSYNVISGNSIKANNINGIRLVGSSSKNSISGNNITNNINGIFLGSSSENSISGNDITNNGNGIYLKKRSFNNKFYHNNLVDNAKQVYSLRSTNVWDAGYPSGGNYWSDYSGADFYRGPHQDIAGSDGTGDTPYIIDADNQDRYPFMTPLPVTRVWDIAVANVVPSKTAVTQGESLDINVTVANQGTFNETFDVTLYSELTSLVGYWKFDEGSGGTAYESSGNDNSGTISGATWTSGKIGNALQFDGTDDYVEVPHSDSLNLTNTGTITAWIRIPSVGTVNRGNIANKGGAWNRRGWMLATFRYSRIRFHWQSGADKFIDSQTTLTYNEWHHVAAVMDGTVMKIYIDGVQDPNTLLNTESADTTTPIRIGKTDYYGHLPFNGKIDEVRTYNIALSEQEIRVLATTGRFAIQTQTVTLTNGSSTTIIFTWNTTGFAKGSYRLSAYASPVPGETDTSDNILLDGIVEVIENTRPVGGVYIPINKLQLLAPYIGLTILLAVAATTVVYVKKRKRNTEINSFH